MSAIEAERVAAQRYAEFEPRRRADEAAEADAQDRDDLAELTEIEQRGGGADED